MYIFCVRGDMNGLFRDRGRGDIIIAFGVPDEKENRGKESGTLLCRKVIGVYGGGLYGGNELVVARGMNL